MWSWKVFLAANVILLAAALENSRFRPKKFRRISAGRRRQQPNFLDNEESGQSVESFPDNSEVGEELRRQSRFRGSEKIRRHPSKNYSEIRRHPSQNHSEGGDDERQPSQTSFVRPRSQSRMRGSLKSIKEPTAVNVIPPVIPGGGDAVPVISDVGAAPEFNPTPSSSANGVSSFKFPSEIDVDPGRMEDGGIMFSEDATSKGKFVPRRRFKVNHLQMKSPKTENTGSKVENVSELDENKEKMSRTEAISGRRRLQRIKSRNPYIDIDKQDSADQINDSRKPAVKKRIRRPDRHQTDNKPTHRTPVRNISRHRIKINMVDRARTQPKPTNQEEDDKGGKTAESITRTAWESQGGKHTQSTRRRIEHKNEDTNRFVHRKKVKKDDQRDQDRLLRQRNKEVDEVKGEIQAKNIIKSEVLADEDQAARQPETGAILKLNEDDGTADSGREGAEDIPEKAELVDVIHNSETRTERVIAEKYLKLDDMPVPRGVFPQSTRILLRARRH